MARKSTTTAPSEALVAAGLNAGLSPAETLTPLKWFGKLPENVQGEAISETQGLAEDLLAHNNTGLKVGRRLAKMRDLLEPHRVFNRYCKHFHLSIKTAYRYMKRAQNAASLPEAVVQAAMARNIEIGGDTDARPYGAYTGAVKKLPPPVNPTPEQAVTWLQQVEQVRKDEKQAASDASLATGGESFVMPEPTDPKTALKECFRFVRNRYRQLPDNSRTRGAWMRQFIGMLLSEIGVKEAQQIAPIVVPEDFRQGRGAPVKRTAEQAAAAVN